MSRIWLATRLFFQVLFNAQLAERTRAVLQAPQTEPAAGTQAPAAPKPVETAPAAKPVTRSEALTLLEALQREARLIDFVQEDISGYTDEQVGGAVREVHRGCKTVLDRMFAIVPVEGTAEGSSLTVSDDVPAARVRIVGSATDTRPITGTLIHSGWQAARCQLPTWNGTSDTEMILAPAEVEVS